jgi:serine/threonine-protein kinase
MSPQQAKGKAVDKRADIWAWGCVLFECLTAKRAFEGETITETLASILKGEPDWDSLPELTPWKVKDLLQRCLAKEPRERLHDVSDARIEINQAIREPTALSTAPSLPGTYSKRQLTIAAVVAGLLMIMIGGVISWNLKPVPESATQPISRFAHILPEDQRLSGTAHLVLAISPDGTKIIYSANNQIYLRKTDELEASPIHGTDEDIANPFFSPDSQWIGFWTTMDNTLKKIPVTGGTPLTLCKATNPFGASWESDNTIVFGQGRTIVRVSADGGTPEVLINLESGETAYGPQLLPGNENVLFAVTSVSGDDRWDKAQIVMQSLETGEREVLIPAGAEVRYVPTGHIVYAVEETLYAVPFDLAKHEVTGSAVPILEGVMRTTWPIAGTGAANFNFSNLGSLVYIPGGVEALEIVLAFVDRDGIVQKLPADPHRYERPRLSPDGKRVAVGIDSELWIYDITRNTLDQLTFEGGEQPCWTPDGKRITFRSSRDGAFNIYWKSADFGGEAQRLTTSENQQRPFSWSPEGDILIFGENSPTTGWDLWSLSLDDAGKPQPIIQTEVVEQAGILSPDGRWLAYYSTEEGQRDIYVQAFPPGSGGKWRISTEGGRTSRWAQNGKELFYWDPSNRLMAVEVTTEPTFTRGNPVPLRVELSDAIFYWNWDVTPDGKRFLVLQPVEDTDSTAPLQQINIVLNWFEELKRLCPPN